MASTRKAVSVAQPPVQLTSPTSWTPEEKRLVQQLDSILKDIYRRWGRLGLSDFTVSLQQTFGRTVTVDNFDSVFKQTADSLSVLFGTDGELQGPTFEVSPDRLFARVREVQFDVVDANGKIVSTFKSNNGAFQTDKIVVKDIECPTVLKWTDQYFWLITDDKTIPGAMVELSQKIQNLQERVAALETPPEEA